MFATHDGGTPSAARCALWLAIMALLAGCGRWQSDGGMLKRDPRDPAKQRTIQKPQPDFDLFPVKVLPYDIAASDIRPRRDGDPNATGGGEGRGATGSSPEPSSNVFAHAKPGHWSTVRQAVRANNFDYRGVVAIEATHMLAGAQRRAEILLEGSPFQPQFRKAAILPKSQLKFLDVNLLLPMHARPASSGLDVQISARGGMASGAGAAQMSFLRFLRPQEFYFVVLARERDRYAYVGLLPMAMPRGEEYEIVRQYLVAANPGIAPPAEPPETELTGDIDLAKYPLYRVVRPEISPQLPIPLPTSPLTWTSIACLLWDDVPPDQLSDEQKTALVDWLHWGGQLLISGPDSLAALRGTFLEPYLPAQAGASVELDAAALQPLQAYWTPRDEPTLAEVTMVTKPWLAVRLVPAGAAESVETLVRSAGEDPLPLVVERRIGRGRIVATAFRLTDRDFVNWRHADGFFNGCLLRRPPRAYMDDPITYRRVLTWANQPERRFDGQIVSRLRIFSRDAGASLGEEASLDSRGGASSQEMAPRPESSLRRQAARLLRTPGPPDEGDFMTEPVVIPDPPRDVARWDDFNPVASAAREILRQAAGIEIPRGSFVLLVLFFYLMALVPINYAVFYLIGRLEWAWFAVPIIALAGAAVVIKLAQLDIGFVRSRTEVAVLEAHAGYPRGHVTRFIALYTSLSSEYTVRLGQAGALVLPMAINVDYAMRFGQEPTRVRYQSEANTELTGFPVVSNSTSMVHCEQMLDLGGQVEFRVGAPRPEIVYKLPWDLKEAIVLEQNPTEGPRVGWVGDVYSGMPRSFVWTRLQPGQQPRDIAPPAGPAKEHARLDLEPLRILAEDFQEMEPGEVRLVGRIDAMLPGASIEPEAPQVATCTLLVVYLKHGELPPPRPDMNYMSPSEKDFEDSLYLK